MIHSSSQGLKETSKTTKASLERTHQLAGGGGGHLWPGTVWEAPLPWRTHLPSEAAVTKDGGHVHQHQEQHLERFFEENKHH